MLQTKHWALHISKVEIFNNDWFSSVSYIVQWPVTQHAIGQEWVKMSAVSITKTRSCLYSCYGISPFKKNMCKIVANVTYKKKISLFSDSVRYSETSLQHHHHCWMTIITYFSDTHKISWFWPHTNSKVVSDHILNDVNQNQSCSFCLINHCQYTWSD